MTMTTQHHLILLGDSVFDNGIYVGDGPDVSSQVQAALPTSWRSTLLALDGATAERVAYQLNELPEDASHLVLSVGGNDALTRIDVLQAQVATSAEAFLLMAEASAAFEISYRNIIESILSRGLPLILCTIYNANFPDRRFQQCVRVAVAVYNDVILRVATERNLAVIDLRAICCEEQDLCQRHRAVSGGWGEDSGRDCGCGHCQRRKPARRERIRGILTTGGGRY